MTQKSIIFSIIIPFKFWSSNLTECLQKMRALTLKEFELILLTDEEMAIPEKFLDLPVILNPTGQINPAAKRDLGAKKAKGEFLAFIDDDAYPRYDWLNVAQRTFKEHQEKGALGDPAVSPKTDPFWARISGEQYF